MIVHLRIRSHAIAIEGRSPPPAGAAACNPPDISVSGNFVCRLSMLA
jgi:hypothetical protein